MSHSMNIKETTLIFDGDYQGTVTIITSSGELKVPAEALIEFAVNYVRSRKIEKLEQASVDEIFGV